MSEFRISLRRLLRSPGYLAAAVLSLAAGIAVCVAAFSLVNAMVFQDVTGIRDRRTLMRINWSTRGGLFSIAEFDVLEQLRPPALAGVAAQEVLNATLLGLSAFDPPSLLGSLGVRALATGAATLPPVLRATRIDPVRALREL